MERWHDLFLGELGAAAALAGLLFVSMSVNQERIFSLGRMADRAVEALAMLFLVIAIATLGLTPGQPACLFGAEIATLVIALLVWLLPVQRAYLAHLDMAYRRRAGTLVLGVRFAIGTIAMSGAILVVTNRDWALYLLVPGVLGALAASLVDAWVLLVEINR